MLIANPIYDVVFKYLMDDSKVAKLLIAAIIGEEIIDLEFRPQELIGEAEKLGKGKKKNKSQMPITNLTVYRLDFSAKIKTPEGEQLVIIEIQKVKLLNDIMRFRKYLGKQYSEQENSYLIKNKKDKLVRVGIPIISIYFLGEELDNIHGVPVVMVNNQAIDLHSGKHIKEKDAFIESLTHKSYIISIPDLNHRRRNELEMLLSIFDQSTIFESHYILNVREEDFPEKYRDVIRRLQKAISESSMRNQMQIEDDFVSELSEYERMILDKEQALRASRKELLQAAKALEESQREKTQTAKALEESQREKTQTAKALEESQREKTQTAKALEESQREKTQTAKALEESQREKTQTAKALEESQRERTQTAKALEESQREKTQTAKALEESQREKMQTAKALEESQKQAFTVAENCLKQGLDIETTTKITQLPLQMVIELAKKLGL